MVSGSFPLGETSPVRTAAVPAPPTIPPCHTYITAETGYLSIKLMSISPPVFSRTTVLSNAEVTRRSMSSSRSESRNAPFSSLLSISSPAVRPMMTIAASAREAAPPTSSSVSGISF